MLRNKRPLLFLASLLLATACTGGNGDSSDLRSLSHGPDLPEECQICWVDFETCAEAGLDIELCEEAVIACAQVCEAPPPPIECDHCFAGYEACVEQAEEGMQDVGDCVSGLDSCLVSCELPEPCLDGSCPPPPCDYDPATGNMECPPIPCDIQPDGSSTCPSPPPTECEDFCTQQCYYEQPQPGNSDGSGVSFSPECFEQCMDECSVPPEPCYEVCWDCAPDDFTCESGCATVCEPEPDPCYEVCPPCPDGQECDLACEIICEPEPCSGGCDTVCDDAGNCDEICWEECPGDGGEPQPAPTN